MTSTGSSKDKSVNATGRQRCILHVTVHIWTLGLTRCKKKIGKKNAPDFDVERYVFNIWKVNVMAIPSMSAISLLQLIGELGHDFVGKFENCHMFCNWLNLVPNNKISGGKPLSSKIPKRTNACGQIFQLCANSLKKNMPHNARFLYQQPKIEINNYLIVNWFSLPLQFVKKHLVLLLKSTILWF